MRTLKNSALTIIIWTALFCLSSIAVTAQTNLEVYKADLSLDFETVSGKLFALNNDVVFVNDEKPENSFAIDKNNIDEISKDDSVLKIRTKNTVRIGEGTRSTFAFRLRKGSPDDLIARLSKDSTRSKSADNAPGPNAQAISRGVYEVTHKHRLYGSCTGRIVVKDDRISFESSDDRDHSRQWLFTDIKKMKRESPYKLEVKPFNGDGYSLEVLGQGIDIIDYKMIEDKLALAKAAR